MFENTAIIVNTEDGFPVRSFEQLTEVHVLVCFAVNDTLHHIFSDCWWICIYHVFQEAP